MTNLNSKKIFIICPVRNVSEEDKKSIEDYVAELERKGHLVHYPARDTDQTKTGYDICTCNVGAIKAADEVHIWYDDSSTGTKFDMGAAFALDKFIRLINKVDDIPEGKSFKRMLYEWKHMIDYKTYYPGGVKYGSGGIITGKENWS